MSLPDPTSRGEKCEELLEEKLATEHEESSETEEDDTSADTESRPRKTGRIYFRRRTMKPCPGRLTVSLRNRKSIRQAKSKKSTEITKRKKTKERSVRKKKSEKKEETPKLGKRCRLGGKAKVKPLASQENQEKNDSDEDSDSIYFSRISLGHFQQLNDKTGASTSHGSEEERSQVIHSQQNKTQNKNSEEEELQELQMWGRNVLNTYFCTLKSYGNYRKWLGGVNK